MPKPIEKTKSGLKLRTQPREKALTLRLGVKKYVLPVEARLLTSEEYVFLHIPPTAEIYKLEAGNLVAVTDSAVAEAAAGSFRKSRKSGGKRSPKSVELPAELSSALGKIPAGYKIGYNADGSVKLVRARRRRK